MRGPIASLVVAGALLAGVGLSGRAATDPAAVEAYHGTIRDAAAAFPVDFGVWIGHEVDVPPSATQLLRPNAIVAREYRTEAMGGASATLMLVQCADIRDMQGHYPPNCYPAHGWTRGDADADARFGPLPAVRYEYTQRVGTQDRAITVYNLFVMPTGEVALSMNAVGKAGADYLLRPYGAAQVQVVIGGEIDRERHPWILSQMHEIAAPVLEVLLAGAPPHSQGDNQ